MNTENTASVPFDEQAALEELERLQRAIAASRRQRGQTVSGLCCRLPRPVRSRPPSRRR
jgi:hypothetical protein